MFDMVVSSIKLDQEHRIVIVFNELFAKEFLTKENRKQLRGLAQQVLGEDMTLFEAASTSCRITVVAGKEEASKEKVETEMRKGFDMAMDYLGKMKE